jgi:hypothetical protein
VENLASKKNNKKHSPTTSIAGERRRGEDSLTLLLLLEDEHVLLPLAFPFVGELLNVVCDQPVPIVVLVMHLATSMPTIPGVRSLRSRQAGWRSSAASQK